MHNVVLDYAVYCPHTVSPSDFFSLIVCPAVVINSDFIYPTMSFGYFCGDFRFKSKSVLLDLDTLNDLTAKNFVTGFHVSKI